MREFSLADFEHEDDIGHARAAKLYPIDAVFSFSRGLRVPLIKAKKAPEKTSDASYLFLILGGGCYHLSSFREDLVVAQAFAERGFDAAYIPYATRRKHDSLVALGATTRFSRDFNLSSDAENCPVVILARDQVCEVIERLRGDASFGYAQHNIILCGFSAGGHLASLVSTKPRTESGRPDGTLLCYPVISSQPELIHEQSFVNMARSQKASDWQVFSTETLVDEKTPPAYIWTTAEDRTVSPKNSLAYAEAMWAKGRTAELHVYPKGDHGCSLATPAVEPTLDFKGADPYKAPWIDRAINFFQNFVH